MRQHRNFWQAGGDLAAPCRLLRHRRALGNAVFLLLVAQLVPGLLHAHDFWIEPNAYHVEPGRTLAIALRVGEHFQGDAVARQAERIERFFAVGPAGEVAVEGAEGAEPAGYVRIGAPGLHLLGYRGRRSFIELPAATFEAYLKEEGLDHVLALRAARGDSEKPGREVYSRCAKSVIASGESAAGFDRRLGFPLELVPAANPCTLASGSELPVLILYEGKPLAGALVVAIPAARPQGMLSGRSDAAGRTLFRLSQPGPWLVKAVHMVPAPPETGADWESLWASLTFAAP